MSMYVSLIGIKDGIYQSGDQTVPPPDYHALGYKSLA